MNRPKFDSASSQVVSHYNLFNSQVWFRSHDLGFFNVQEVSAVRIPGRKTVASYFVKIEMVCCTLKVVLDFVVIHPPPQSTFTAKPTLVFVTEFSEKFLASEYERWEYDFFGHIKTRIQV